MAAPERTAFDRCPKARVPLKVAINADFHQLIL